MNDTLAQQQKEFLACLQQVQPVDQSSFRHHVQESGLIDVNTRLGIYKNAYQVRLQETINTDHTILGQYLGDDLYQLMMNDYINQHPSHQFSLRHFSDELPNFLQSHPPFNEHPQLAELARFERRLLNAFDAPNSECATFKMLQNLPTEQWPFLKLRFHPSVQILENSWNVVEIFKALQEDKVPPDAVIEANNWLLWRNHSRLTEFRPIDDIAFTMLNSFNKGRDFSQVCQALLEFIPEQEVSNTALQVLIYWLNSGVVARLVSD